MNRLGQSAIIGLAILAASCVSSPAERSIESAEGAVGAQPVTAAPVRKERIEEVSVPFVTKETMAFADGVVDKTIEYAYSEGNRRLLRTTTRKPSQPDPIERTEYRYEADRLVARETVGRDGATSSRSAYEYGPRGELVKETVLDGKGLVQSVSEWTWDSGRKASWRVLDASGAALARTDYFYDGETLASASLFDGSGGPKGRVEYAYAPGGALSEVRYFGPSGAPDGRIVYELAEGKTIRESVFRADGRLERRLEYSYGPDGALIGRALQDASGRLRERISYENAYRIDTRVVVYYE